MVVYFFYVWKMGDGDIIRKYTFECGATPAGAAEQSREKSHECVCQVDFELYTDSYSY